MAHRELDSQEQRRIENMLRVKMTVDEIAAVLGRHRSTIYREIGRTRFVDPELPYLLGYWGGLPQTCRISVTLRHRFRVRTWQIHVRRMRMSRLSMVLGATAVAALTLAPMLPMLDTQGFGAAHAKNEKGDGGKGGNGNGKGSEGSNGKEKSANGKSTDKSKSATTTSVPKPSKAAKAVTTDVVDTTLAPQSLGKMNGALNANINAIAAHIRNGQTTNGPVGLVAGLAVADAAAAAAARATSAVLGLDAAHDALSAALVEAGFVDADGNPDLGAYLGATDLKEDVSQPIDEAITAAGGLNPDGSFVTPEPTDLEILAAEDAAAAAEAGVVAAEEALVGAWNKDGDAEAMLGMVRERLALHPEEIAAAIAETVPVSEEVFPVEESEVDAETETDPAMVMPPGG